MPGPRMNDTDTIRLTAERATAIHIKHPALALGKIAGDRSGGGRPFVGRSRQLSGEIPAVEPKGRRPWRLLFLKLRAVPSRSHGVDHRSCLRQDNWKWSAGAVRF